LIKRRTERPSNKDEPLFELIKLTADESKPPTVLLELRLAERGALTLWIIKATRAP
jgi:hypothetical protein